MGELQLGLVAIGAAVVAAVFLYNKWQERRYRRQAEVNFASRHEDVLMRGERLAQGRDQHAVAPAERVEPVLGPVDVEAIADSLLSDVLDFIVPMEGSEEVSGVAVLEAAAGMLGRTSRPVHWEGFDEARQSWEALRPDGEYSALRAGVQLVDRRGAVDADELARLGAGIEKVAAAVGILATVPDIAPAVARAAGLDRFCDDVDIRVAVHVVGDAASLLGTQVQALAKATGFEPDPVNGKFRRRDDVGRILCTLGNPEATPFTGGMSSAVTNGVTMEFDVPGNPGSAFDDFCNLAHQFARALNARIVDDNGQPLSPAGFDTIREQLEAVHRNMETRGISPGEALALRLFS